MQIQCGTHSPGMTHVWGKMLYSFGNSFIMRVRFLPSRSLRQISPIPGKWLIFCRGAAAVDAGSDPGQGLADLISLHVHDLVHHDRRVYPVDSPVISFAHHRLEAASLGHAPHCSIQTQHVLIVIL